MLPLPALITSRVGLFAFKMTRMLLAPQVLPLVPAEVETQLLGWCCPMATAVVGRVRFVTSMPMNPLLWELNESPAPAREKRRDLSFSSPEKISANNVLIKEGGKKKMPSRVLSVLLYMLTRKQLRLGTCIYSTKNSCDFVSFQSSQPHCLIRRDLET